MQKRLCRNIFTFAAVLLIAVPVAFSHPLDEHEKGSTLGAVHHILTYHSNEGSLAALLWAHIQTGFWGVPHYASRLLTPAGGLV